MEVECAERVPERRRGLSELRSDEAKDRDCAPCEIVVAPQAREPQQDVGEHRVARRCRMVVEVLLATHEPLAVRGRQEEPPTLVVRKQLDGEESEPPRVLQPTQLARGYVELVQPVRDVRVVVEHARVTRLTCPPRPAEASVVRRQPVEQELRAGPRRRDEVVTFEAASRLGKGRDGQAVPRGHGLVVA